MDRDYHVLKGINALVHPGEVMAILGGSGSGKTTLLNAISGRLDTAGEATAVSAFLDKVRLTAKTEAEMGGKVLLNGSDIDIGRVSQITGYVMQHDHLLPNLTVMETLVYAALLRLPRSISWFRKKAIAADVVRELGLWDVRNSRVGGGSGHGISGGEKRRVSIGIQMLKDPSLLFLDEPTSGLDAYTAMRLMETLQTIASQGRTIVLTIHQPRSDIMTLFDKVLLLSKGHQVYFGLPGDLSSWFSSLGYPVPAHVNPADHALDVISIDPENEENSWDRLMECASKFSESDGRSELVQHLQDEVEEANARAREHSRTGLHRFLKEGIGPLHKKPVPRDLKPQDEKMKKEHQVVQTAILAHRSLRNIARDKYQLIILFVQFVLTGLAIGIIYYDLDNDPEDIQNRLAAFFSCLALSIFNVILATILNYTLEFRIFDREVSDDMYRPTAYFFSMVISTTPLLMVSCILFCSIYYFMVGMREGADYFFIHLLLVFLAVNIAQAMGVWCASVTRDITAATTISNLLVYAWVLSGGFLVRTEDMPPYMKILSFTSLYQYAIGALCVNEYKDNVYSDCEEEYEEYFQDQYYNNQAYYSQLSPDARAEQQEARDDYIYQICKLYFGNFYLDQFGFYIDDIGIAFLIMAMVYLVFRLLTLFNVNFLRFKPE